MEERILQSAVPEDLRRIKFEDLTNSDNDFSRCYIIGKVCRHWPLAQRNKGGSLLKCLLREATSDGNDEEDKLTVYFYDKFANDVQPLTCDTYIAFTGFRWEPLTACNPSKELLPCQLLLRPLEKKSENGIEPEIWVLRRRNDSPVDTSTEQSSRKTAEDTTSNHQSTVTSPKRASVQSSPVKPTKRRRYSYTKVGEIKENYNERTKYNIFGLVVSCEMKTSGSQHPYMNLTITDETNERLNCVILGKTGDIFPDVCCGDIIRMHRLQVNEYRHTLQGKCYSPHDVLVFKNTCNSIVMPSTSAFTYTYSEEDKKRAEELRNWKRENDYRTFSELKYGEYANVLCQVLSVAVVSTDTVVLSVWDGTEPACTTEPFQGKVTNVNKCSELLQLVPKFLVDVRLYDCHAKDSRNIQPKQYVEFINIHLLPATARRGAMFCMHSGYSYNRHVAVLSDTNPSVEPLKQKLDDVLKDITPPTEQTNREGRSSIAFEEVQIESHKDVVKEHDTDVGFNVSDSFMADLEENQFHQRSSQEDAVRESEKEAILQEKDPSRLIELPFYKEKWWIRINAATGHDHDNIIPTFIRDVLKHEVPFKFRIFASVMEIWPSADKVQNFIFVYCPRCDFLSPETEMAQKDTVDIECTYCCPNCNRESTDNQPGTSSPAFFLEFTILVQFLLQDGTAQLKASLWKENALEFFKEIKPEHLLNEDTIQAQYFREILWQLCPNIKPASTSLSCEPYPIIDCCLYSYTANNEVKYRIFDTRVI